ncbi:unnamed protein product [Symbiodinium natans]|uniref:Uncharacterized protein n=1 Tax=Symbiodinium natans TaxID=878477 RepID=A0A812M9Y9_9DINO|nr:unnamed protein product [Symbiodinium natans]
MAGQQTLIAFLLFASVRGDVRARNLQALDGLMDATCMTSCPGSLNMLMDVSSFLPQDTGLEGLLALAAGGEVSGLVGALAQAMCKHTSVMTCMATQCVPENATTGSNTMNVSIDTLAQFIPCFCDACPGMDSLLASMASVAPTLQNLTSVPTDALNLACPMVDASECLVTNAQCASLAFTPFDA